MFLDLSDRDSLTGKAQEAVGHYGRVDILINNAGISCRGSVMETQDFVNRKIMEVNFFGTVGWTKGMYVYVTVYRKIGHNAAQTKNFFFALTDSSASRY